MCLKVWDKKIKRLKTTDMQWIKLSVAAFTLMIAKLWPAILSLYWYWYAIIFVLAAIIPLSKMFKK